LEKASNFRRELEEKYKRAYLLHNISLYSILQHFIIPGLSFHLKVNMLSKHRDEKDMRESKGIHLTLDEGTPREMKTKWKLMTVYVLATFRYILPFS